MLLQKALNVVLKKRIYLLLYQPYKEDVRGTQKMQVNNAT
jgi:hypothetical protein